MYVTQTRHGSVYGVYVTTHPVMLGGVYYINQACVTNPRLHTDKHRRGTACYYNSMHMFLKINIMRIVTVHLSNTDRAHYYDCYAKKNVK